MNSFEDQPTQLLNKSAYLNEDWLQHEKRVLFDRSWTFACLADDVREIGDYRTFQFLDHSLVVVRSEAGIQAFHNICRHRGCEVLP